MDVASLKSIIKSMSNGMGTALYTTLTGLVASMILAIQYLLVERGSDCLIERSIQLAIDFSNPEDSV
jgi:biopolymer transport protein ExbB/TolQ